MVPLSRAAAASSAVPLVLSPVTINNYGGSCGYREPGWVTALLDPANPLRPAGRAIQRQKEVRGFEDSANRPFLHLVDGGVSDNLGLRAVLEMFEQIEASPRFRRAHAGSTRSNASSWSSSIRCRCRRSTGTGSERPPNDFQILIKATGVPIDRYSYEGVELLRDIIARWQTIRSLKAAGAFANAGNAALARAADIPDVDLYAIDVSFEAHPDTAERAYLNESPTSFVLTDEQVDRLRRAAGDIMRASPEYQRLLSDFARSSSPKPAVLPTAAN